GRTCASTIRSSNAAKTAGKSSARTLVSVRTKEYHLGRSRQQEGRTDGESPDAHGARARSWPGAPRSDLQVHGDGRPDLPRSDRQGPVPGQPAAPRTAPPASRGVAERSRAHAPADRRVSSGAN